MKEAQLEKARDAIDQDQRHQEYIKKFFFIFEIQ